MAKVKIEMLVSMQGPGTSRDPGDVVEVDSKESDAMIAKGYAKPAGKAKTKPSKTANRKGPSATR